MGRLVWIFARPVELTNFLPSRNVILAGKYHFCHWGVFVTAISEADLNAILLRTNTATCMEEIELGVMYEIFPDENKLHVLDVTRPFKVSTLKNKWETLSVRPIGMTEFLDDKIDEEGI